MKIRSVRAEFFYSDRRTERNYESNIRFSKILRKMPKNSVHTARRTLSVCSEIIIIYCDNLRKVKCFVLTKHRLPVKCMWLVN